MSVIIKGMKIPRHCGECGIEWCERWKKLIIAGMSIARSRPTDCPLAEVPTPHGDLIDRDALGIRDAEKQAYEEYLKEKGKFYVEGSFIEYMQGRFEGLSDASGRIRFAPTIIPAEEE